MIVHIKMVPMEGVLRKQRGVAGLEKEPLTLSGWLRKGNPWTGPKNSYKFHRQMRKGHSLMQRRTSLCRVTESCSNSGVWQIGIELFEWEWEMWPGDEQQMRTEGDKAWWCSWYSPYGWKNWYIYTEMKTKYFWSINEEMFCASPLWAPEHNTNISYCSCYWYC